MGNVILLGPQRHQPILGELVKTKRLNGPLAVISAGWQEREQEVEELDAVLGLKTISLNLHRRAEAIFHQAPAFRVAHRDHQNNLKKLTDLYRMRLNYAQGAVQDLMNRQDEQDPDYLDPEIEDALESVRSLDRHHLHRLNQANDEFHEKWGHGHGSKIMDHHYELAGLIGSCDAVLVAGGHVAVLLNRMRLLKLDALLRQKLVIAWSAGAMALGEKVVLFHDTPPQGRGYAEVMEEGLKVHRGLIPLPHAEKRLLLNDPIRVAMLAGRFPEEICLAMDSGSRVEWNGRSWKNPQKVRILRTDGRVERWQK